MAGDLDLVRRLLADRNDAAWTRFERDFRPIVLKAVHVSARRFGITDVEDAAAEVFVELLKDGSKLLRSYRGESSFSTWITVVSFRIANREFARRIRKSKVDAAHSPPEPSPPPDADILEKLSRLPERDRRALVLFHIENRSYSEIAAAIGIAANQVGMVLLRARESLARILKDPR